MGLLSKRKNKKFNYNPRFYKGEGSPYEIKQKFDDYRKTVGDAPNFKQKINNALTELKEEQNTGALKRTAIILAVLVLIFLFIIDFDLSIFF